MYDSDDRIVKTEPRGQQIGLCCVNHPDKRWMTKNIAPIGCRTLFYNLMDNAPDSGPECDCPLSALKPI